MTTASDVLKRFAGRSKNASRLYSEWKAHPDRIAVVDAVTALSTNVLDSATPEQVRSVASTTEHALGDSTSAVARKVTIIRDWSPPFAFTHVFHIATERLGFIPRWQDFRQASRDDDEIRSMVWEPARAITNEAVALGWDKGEIREALRWRIGNAYYSFLREMHVFSVLKNEMADINVHPLADALFRVDLWSCNVNINLFIGNPIYRKQSVGRKMTSASLLGDAAPKFEFVDIELEPRRAFGVVHLVNERDIVNIIHNISTAASDRSGG
jgi:hypothetical protein